MLRRNFKQISSLLAMRYEMEKKFQKVYTVSKFKEVQEGFIDKVYYDLMSALEGWEMT